MNLKLKMQILKLGKRQVALAQEIGVPEAVLSKIVNGWIQPGDDLKERIAGALNCELREIFSDSERESCETTAN